MILEQSINQSIKRNVPILGPKLSFNLKPKCKAFSGRDSMVTIYLNGVLYSVVIYFVSFI